MSAVVVVGEAGNESKPAPAEPQEYIVLNV